MTDLILTEDDYRQLVQSHDGKPTTDSLKVAKYFGKSHKAVLRKIANKKCSANFTERNFALSDYVDSSGRTLPMWEMTKSGFMFVAMGFTGEKADLMKEGFIDAFDWMADQLENHIISYEQRRNYLTLEYKQEMSLASFAGKTLQRWQVKKPIIEGEMLALEQSGQGVLQLH